MIHWVVDRALGRNDGSYERLLDALDRTHTPYTLVRKPPFADYLIGMRDDIPITLDLGSKVFTVGTASMKLVADNHGWNPGYVDAPDQAELLGAWGDHLLNADAVVAPMRDIVPPAEVFFARPVEDSKAFAGAVFKRGDFLEWQKLFNGEAEGYVTLSGDTLVMAAPLKTIYAEYRLFVIGGEIVTGSLYKLGDQVVSKPMLDPAMIAFAEARLAEYCPRRALCLDIAQVEGAKPTYKVIETNAISSSGFYACDLQRFVGAINHEFS